MDPRYRGKVCPYCKTTFQEDDDIVLCSVCEMPHHKDCWVENKGCTTFGCLGTIRGIGGVELEIQSATVYCIHCGTPNGGSALYCTACGNVVDRPLPQASGYAPQAPGMSPGYASPSPAGPVPYDAAVPPMARPVEPPMDRRLAADYVGPQGGDYLADFQYMAQTGKTAYWNPLLSLTSPYWFLHRKMYGTGIAWMLLCLFLVGLQPVFGFLVAIGGRVLFGFWGEYLYKKHIDRLLTERTMLPPEMQAAHLQNWGGTRPVLAASVAAVYLMMMVVVILIRMGIL